MGDREHMRVRLHMFHAFMFRCKWLENNIKVNKLGFILVDFNKEGHKENTFILASQAK